MRLKSSSMPGRIASSSATVSWIPLKVMNSVSQVWMIPQWLESSSFTSTSTASSLSSMRVGRGPTGLSRASARLWAESVESTRVRFPSRAERTAVAAERLVFPTPPFPE